MAKPESRKLSRSLIKHGASIHRARLHLQSMRPVPERGGRRDAAPTQTRTQPLCQKGSAWQTYPESVSLTRTWKQCSKRTCRAQTVHRNSGSAGLSITSKLSMQNGNLYSWGREKVRASAEDSPARLNQSRPGPDRLIYNNYTRRETGFITYVVLPMALRSPRRNRTIQPVR